MLGCVLRMFDANWRFVALRFAPEKLTLQCNSLLYNGNEVAYILEVFHYFFSHRAFHHWRRLCDAADD